MSTEFRYETEFLDFGTPAVREFVRQALHGDLRASLNETERAVRLYYAVRDRIRYEVYGVDMSRHGFRASTVIERGVGFCVHKSIVYAAALRAVGVPSRLAYCDVRNHLSSPRLRDLAGGDVFRFHGFVSVFLDRRWVKATPVFDKLLCRLYRITPLDFDGRADSVYHPYDENGRRHMEILRTRGEYADFPYELVVGGIRQAHPKLFRTPDQMTTGSLTTEAAQ